LLDDLHHRSEAVRAMPDEFVVCGGGDEVKVIRELGDPCENGQAR